MYIQIHMHSDVYVKSTVSLYICVCVYVCVYIVCIYFVRINNFENRFLSLIFRVSFYTTCDVLKIVCVRCKKSAAPGKYCMQPNAFRFASAVRGGWHKPIICTFVDLSCFISLYFVCPYIDIQKSAVFVLYMCTGTPLIDSPL